MINIAQNQAEEVKNGKKYRLHGHGVPASSDQCKEGL